MSRVDRLQTEAGSDSARGRAVDDGPPPLEGQVAGFWTAGESLGRVCVDVAPPVRPLELLEKLGPSPFERGGFPVVGFLATTYEKVTRYAVERG